MNSWNPDGTQIAYTAEVINDASGEGRVSYRGPVFSPDGRKVAFWAWDKSYKATL